MLWKQLQFGELAIAGSPLSNLSLPSANGNELHMSRFRMWFVAGVVLSLSHCISPTLTLADQTNINLTVEGVTYTNATFRHVTPATVTIVYSAGIVTVPLATLPTDLQQRFGYDPRKAADWMAASARETAEIQRKSSNFTGGAPEARGTRIADYICTVADDFIVDVYHNGKVVTDDKRTLLAEKYGATAERIDVPVQKGDWVVFTVANNRLRWNGSYYFAAAGMIGTNAIVFQTNVGDRRWSYCDDSDNVSRFISDPHDRGNPVLPVSKPWDQGDDSMKAVTSPSWSGDPVWGHSRLTWIKFVAE